MLTIDCADGHLQLSLNGVTLLSHSAERPFATAVRREKSYQSDRGTVKVTARVTARVPLTELQREADGRFRFSAEGHSLLVSLREIDGGAELQFSGESGWAYEFSLPAEPGEAVFGGGEQYRQVNLRGERVVNFVSEHIKASTIAEKAFLPRSRATAKSRTARSAAMRRCRSLSPTAAA